VANRRGGCHSHRDTQAAIEAAGFVIDDIERLRIPETRIPTHTSPHILGVATKDMSGAEAWPTSHQVRCVRSGSAARAAGSLAAGDLGAKGVEALVPEAAEAVEPGVHGLQRDGVE
jgi:hypothetical protein